MSDKKDYFDIVSYMAWFLNRAAEIVDYEHNEEDTQRELAENLKQVRDAIAKIGFENITYGEALTLRFGNWDDETILCPLYAHPILMPEKDNDIRHGCIASGWKVKDGVIQWEEKGGING